MTLYIDTQYLTENTNISQNVDVATLMPNIVKAQDIYISKFLGTEIDSYLKNAIEVNTLTSTDSELLVLIQKALAEYSAYCSYVDILFKMFNKGLLSGGSNNASIVSRNDMCFIRDISLEQATFYINEVKLFLDSHTTDYPSWNKCSDKKIPNKFPIIF